MHVLCEGSQRDCPQVIPFGFTWTANGSISTAILSDDLGALVCGLTPQRQKEEDRSIATAVSDDSKVVAGESGFKPPRDAFIWTPQIKMVKLSD